MQIFLKRISKNSVEKESQTLSSSFLQTLTPQYLPQKKLKI
jgi:hypothetical protein